MSGINLNVVHLVGRAGRDATLERVNDRPVANFPLATHRRFKTADGEWEERTDWHQIAFWGPLAEAVARHVKKGSVVRVSGHLENRRIEKGNEPRYSVQVVGDGFDVDRPQPAETPDSADSPSQ